MTSLTDDGAVPQGKAVVRVRLTVAVRFLPAFRLYV
jgi:hypothetical protein